MACGHLQVQAQAIPLREPTSKPRSKNKRRDVVERKESRPWREVETAVSPMQSAFSSSFTTLGRKAYTHPDSQTGKAKPSSSVAPFAPGSPALTGP